MTLSGEIRRIVCNSTSPYRPNGWCMMHAIQALTTWEETVDFVSLYGISLYARSKAILESVSGVKEWQKVILKPDPHCVQQATPLQINLCDSAVIKATHVAIFERMHPS